MQRLKIRNEQKGVSITEIMITLPIITIILLTLVSALFNLYASGLAESARTNLRVNGQTLLINLQDELLFTISYGETLDVNLADPFQPSGGWDYDTTPETLIINEVALDSTRRDEDRHIVRRQINNCTTSAITDNPVAINNVIYFVEDVPGSEYDRLYKRTVTPTFGTCSIDLVTGDPCVPSTATCKGNAKETTCPSADVGTGNCTGADSLLSENVLDFQISYFEEDNVETTFPSAADKIEVVLTLGDKVFGKQVQTEIRHTIRKIN